MEPEDVTENNVAVKKPVGPEYPITDNGLLIKLPGFIDVHVYVQEPHTSFRESFDRATAAALAGGFTLICVMPNTCPPIIDEKSLDLFQIYTKESARCDYALYAAASNSFCGYRCDFASQTAALKLFLIDKAKCNDNCCAVNKSCPAQHLINVWNWKKHILSWPSRVPGPIVCHASKYNMATIILYAYICDRSIHISHVTTKEEIVIIRACKDRGMNVTCEICVHNLFLSTEDISRIPDISDNIKQFLISPEDQKALWDNLDYIDVFSTFHSPLTNNCFHHIPNIPGLEIVLPLLFNAVKEGRLTLNDIIIKFYKNPKKIFKFPDQKDTYILVNMDEEWTLPEEMQFSENKVYAGMQAKGKIYRVVLRGEVAFNRGELLVPEGFGKDIRHKCYSHWKFCMT